VFSRDGLHMNAHGYALWTSIIKPVLLGTLWTWSALMSRENHRPLFPLNILRLSFKRWRDGVTWMMHSFRRLDTGIGWAAPVFKSTRWERNSFGLWGGGTLALSLFDEGTFKLREVYHRWHCRTRRARVAEIRSAVHHRP
jgi:hypothetical protein